MIPLEAWEIDYCTSTEYLAYVKNQLKVKEVTTLMAKLFYIHNERDPNDERFWDKQPKQEDD